MAHEGRRRAKSTDGRRGWVKRELGYGPLPHLSLNFDFARGREASPKL